MMTSGERLQKNRFLYASRRTTRVTKINSDNPESDARRARMRARYLQLRAEYLADGRIQGLEALEPSSVMTPEEFVSLLRSDKELPTGKS
jgi:hypothetical protein